MDIEVEILEEDPWHCLVTLHYDDTMIGEYQVLMSGDEYRKYGGDRDPEELVQATLQFLLDHESPDAIMDRFSLSDVEEHFPEYAEKIESYP